VRKYLNASKLPLHSFSSVEGGQKFRGNHTKNDSRDWFTHHFLRILVVFELNRSLQSSIDEAHACQMTYALAISRRDVPVDPVTLAIKMPESNICCELAGDQHA
jgi:hypothetical protein